MISSPFLKRWGSDPIHAHDYQIFADKNGRTDFSHKQGFWTVNLIPFTYSAQYMTFNYVWNVWNTMAWCGLCWCTRWAWVKLYKLKLVKLFELICHLFRSLIRKLLTTDRTKRLGTMRGGAEDVKTHRWFREINWEDVREKKLEVQFYESMVFQIQFYGLSEVTKRFPEPKNVLWYPFGVLTLTTLSPSRYQSSPRLTTRGTLTTLKSTQRKIGRTTKLYQTQFSTSSRASDTAVVQIINAQYHS